MSTLGERLKFLRSMKQKTQAEIGHVINVSKSTISSYEHDKVIPSTQNLVRLAKYFDVNVNYIIGDGKRMFDHGKSYAVNTDKNSIQTADI